MDVTANLVSTTQLDTWMQASVQRTLATADEWCYAMTQILGVEGCPGTQPGTGDLFGLNDVLVCCGMLGDSSNRNTLPQISSSQFLNCLRQSQLNYNASAPAPGGSLTTPGTSTMGGNKGQVPPPSGSQSGGGNQPGQGVLGLTNCTVCQQLASNPIMLLILAVAAWYLFFK